MEERAEFGELLRRYRLAAGLTQEALAERTGLSVRGLSDLERGARRAPQPGTVRRLVQALDGVVEGPRRSLEGALAWLLREQDLLLILDNCEHLIDVCATLVERLLRSCPHLRVIATSREPLGIGGEQLYDVSPLTIPAEGERDLARLRANEAVRFFAERARLARPSFALTEETSEAVTGSGPPACRVPPRCSSICQTRSGCRSGSSSRRGRPRPATTPSARKRFPPRSPPAVR